MSHLVKYPAAILALFIATVAIGDWTIAYVLRQAMWSSQSRYARLYTERAQADLAVIGNSRAVHGFHAPTMRRVLNQETINLSSNGLSLEVVNAVLQDYLDHNPPPKLAIVEISGVHFAPAALTDLKVFSEKSPRLQTLLFREFPTTTRAGMVSHLFSLNSEGFQRSMVYLRKSDQDLILQNTMSERLARYAPANESDRFPETNQGRKYEKKNLAALTALVERAKRDNVELRLILTPFWPAYRQQVQEWDAVVAKLQTAAGDVPIWDYSLALDQRSDFADRWHTNLTGATRLLEILQADGFFEPGARPRD
jgi:hypothetical protein